MRPTNLLRGVLRRENVAALKPSEARGNLCSVGKVCKCLSMCTFYGKPLHVCVCVCMGLRRVRIPAAFEEAANQSRAAYLSCGSAGNTTTIQTLLQVLNYSFTAGANHMSGKSVCPSPLESCSWRTREVLQDQWKQN